VRGGGEGDEHERVYFGDVCSNVSALSSALENTDDHSKGVTMFKVQ
jgi:hypothetical protein